MYLGILYANKQVDGRFNEKNKGNYNFLYFSNASKPKDDYINK